jgi:ABC-2 type transport system ATP-binding protein
MKQRLGIAAALLGDPDLLILDEPTNGLDPTGMRQMRELLRDLAATGLTLLVSSHLLAELEQVCDWLIIIDHGQQVFQGPADELLNAGRHSVWLRSEDPDHLAALADLAGGADAGVRLEADRLLLLLDAEDEADVTARLASLNRAAQRHGITLSEIAPVQTSLEERYSALVTRKEF